MPGLINPKIVPRITSMKPINNDIINPKIPGKANHKPDIAVIMTMIHNTCVPNPPPSIRLISTKALVIGLFSVFVPSGKMV